jgi:hypothetical protein
MVIRLVSDTTSVRGRDVAPKGPSVGDSVFSTSRLRNAVAQFGRARGAIVGSDRGTARLVSATRATVDGVASLPGGTLHFRGRLRSTIPVVGGTGRFAGARGTLRVTATSRRDTALNVYTLTFR